MAYRVEFTPRAARDFKSLDGSVRRRIKQRIDSLADNPYPSGIRKIEGEEELYRLRVGDYRILYQAKGKAVLDTAQILPENLGGGVRQQRSRGRRAPLVGDDDGGRAFRPSDEDRDRGDGKEGSLGWGGPEHKMI